jgi:hypothetical protein
LAHNCLGMSLSEVQQICFHRDIARWTASSQVMSSANLSNGNDSKRCFLFPSIPQLYEPSGSKLRWRVRRRRRCEIGEHIGCQPSITMSSKDQSAEATLLDLGTCCSRQCWGSGRTCQFLVNSNQNANVYAGI